MDPEEWDEDAFLDSINEENCAELRLQVLEGTISAFTKGCYAMSDGEVVEIERKFMTHARKRIHKTVQMCAFERLPDFDRIKAAGIKPLPPSCVNPVRVVCEDCVDAAIGLIHEAAKAGRTESATVLDMASNTEPGGTYKTGYGTQEQSLFWRSNLWAHLDTEEDVPNKLYPIPDQCALYAKGVLFIRGNQDDRGFAFVKPEKIDVVAMAGMQYPATKKNSEGFDVYADPDEREAMLNILRTILQASVENGSQNLVLGAIGCGNYRNPPVDVARLFRQALSEYGGYFHNVVFALRNNGKPYGVGNYETFRKILGGFVAVQSIESNEDVSDEDEEVLIDEGEEMSDDEESEESEIQEENTSTSIGGRPMEQGSTSSKPKTTSVRERPESSSASPRPKTASVVRRGLGARLASPTSIGGRPIDRAPLKSGPTSIGGRPIDRAPRKPGPTSIGGRPTGSAKSNSGTPSLKKSGKSKVNKNSKPEENSDTPAGEVKPEKSTEELIKSSYLPDFSGMMKVSLVVSTTVRDRDKEVENRDFVQDVCPRGSYENQKKQECLFFFNPDFESLYKAVRALLHQLYDNHNWGHMKKPSRKLIDQADHSSPTGTLITTLELNPKDSPSRKKLHILAALCQNLKTCMKYYGEEISHSKASIPPVAFEIERNLESPGRLIQSTDFFTMESAFSEVVASSIGQKDKVTRLFDLMNSFKEKFQSETLADRKAKMCFLLYRASEYLKSFEEGMEMKDNELLICMHRMRTQISYDLIEHAFLFVQNASPLFDVEVDRFKMLQNSSCQTFFYLEKSIAHDYITRLHEAIDMKMKIIIENYSPEMISPEEFVAFANNEGKAMKASDEEQIDEMKTRIEEMKIEAKNCLGQFALGMTKQAVSILSTVLMPEEQVKVVESSVFIGIDLLKKIKSFFTDNEEEIEKDKGDEVVEVFQHLIRRQELLRRVHYSNLILRKMKGKAAELLTFMEMVRLYNVLTVRKLDTRNDYIGLLITRRVNPISEFVEFFVRVLDKFSQTPTAFSSN